LVIEICFIASLNYVLCNGKERAALANYCEEEDEATTHNEVVWLKNTQTDIKELAGLNNA